MKVETPEIESPKIAQIHVVRVPLDLREKMNAIASFEMVSQFTAADTLLRPVIEARFAQLPEEMQERTKTRIQSISE